MTTNLQLRRHSGDCTTPLRQGSCKKVSFDDISEFAKRTCVGEYDACRELLAWYHEERVEHLAHRFEPG